MLTSQAGPVQARLALAIEALLEREGIDPGDGLTRHDPAYAVVRVGEAFCYSDVIPGARPDPDAGARIMRRLLG